MTQEHTPGDGTEQVTQEAGAVTGASTSSNPTPVDWEKRYRDAQSWGTKQRDALIREQTERQMLQNQLQGWQQQQNLPTPQWGNDFLTDAERTQLKEAREGLDLDRFQQIQEVATQRRIEANVQHGVQQIGQALQADRIQQSQLDALRQYEELKDPSIHADIAERARRKLVERPGLNQIHALEMAVLDRKAELGNKALTGKANRNSYVDFSDGGAAGAPGDTPAKFNASSMVRPEDRVVIQRMYPGLSAEAAYKRWFENHSKEKQEWMLKNNAPLPRGAA